MAQTIKDNVIYLDGQPVASTAMPDTPTTVPTSTPPVSTPNPGIISSTGYRQQLAGASSQADDLLANDPYAILFDKLRDSNAAQAKQALTEESVASGAKKEAEIEQGARYRAGLETLGIKSGLSQYAPSLQIDRMIQAENLQKSKIAEIDAAEKIAQAKIKQAKTDNDLDVMKEQLQYVQDLRKAKADALESAQKMAFEREKFEWEKYMDTNNGNGSSSILSENDLKNISDLYGVTLPYGTTQQQAIMMLNQKDETSDTISEINEDYLKSNYNTKQLFNIAKAMGITHKTNFTRQDEIDALIAKLPEVVDLLKSEGYSNDEIAAYFDDNA